MPAKKAASSPQKASASNAGWAMWVFLIGVIVAGLAGAFESTSLVQSLLPYLGWLIILAGILSGIFFLDSGDVVNFAIRFILLYYVAKALDTIPTVGPYFSGFFEGIFTFLMPVGLTLLVIYFWKKYIANMM
jgi:hypothetical protein